MYICITHFYCFKIFPFQSFYMSRAFFAIQWNIFISLPGSSLFDEVHKMLLMFLWICEKCFNAVKEETKEFLILNVIFHSEWFWGEKFLTMKDNFSFFGRSITSCMLITTVVVFISRHNTHAQRFLNGEAFLAKIETFSFWVCLITFSSSLPFLYVLFLIADNGLP